MTDFGPASVSARPRVRAPFGLAAREGLDVLLRSRTSAAGAIAVLGLVVVQLFDADGWVGGLAFHLVITAAAVVAARGVYIRRRSRHATASWLIALGLAANAIAELIYTVIEESGRVAPGATAADVFWVLSYVCLIAGMQRRIGRFRPSVDTDTFLDLVPIVVIAVLMLSDAVSVGALVDPNSASFASRLLLVTYPVLDLILLGKLARAVVTGALRGLAGALLGVGTACWLVADFGYAFEYGSRTAGYLNAGWMLGAAAIATTAGAPDGPTLGPAAIRPVGRWRIMMILFPVAIPFTLDLAAHIRGVDSDPLLLALATVILLVCAGWRAIRLADARDEHQRRLQERERFYQTLVDLASDAVVVVDGDGVLLRGSVQLATMTGRPELALPGGSLLLLRSQCAGNGVNPTLRHVWTEPGARGEAEVELVRRDGQPLWLHLKLVNLCDDPSVGGVVANFSDITARKGAELAMIHQAYHDDVTGLPNRTLFRQWTARALDASTGITGSTAVVFLDLDGFKAANDRFGHPAGDLLLSEIGGRLKATLGSVNAVARLGGDEFGVLVAQPGVAVHEAIAVSQRIAQAMKRPFDVHGQQVVLSASIGIAVAGPDADEATLLRDADVAMYRSKQRGTGLWTVHDDAMRVAAIEQFELEIDLAAAVENGQLRLAYHPIMRVETGELAGFEALARWDHPTRGEVSPGVFIPIAERTGAIASIGAWVLEQACHTAAGWHRRHPDIRPNVTVNFSAHQLADPHVVASVASVLHRAGLDPKGLVLEITESALVEDPDAAAARLAELRLLGVRVAVDDFGTGYSSFSYLSRLPVDILKLDQSFVRTITAAGVPPIVRGMLDLTRTLKLEVIAEGVEHTCQLDGLRAERCGLAQGFLFAEPLSAEQTEDYIERAATSRSPFDVARVDNVVPLRPWAPGQIGAGG